MKKNNKKYDFYQSAPNYFLQENEQKQNKLLIKLLICFTGLFVLGLILYKFSLIKIKNIDILETGMIISSVSTITSILIFKFIPYSSLIKYFLLISTEIMAVSFGLAKGTEVYLSYVFVPVISCIFLNERFTIKMCIFSYVSMIATMLLKAFVFMPRYKNPPSNIVYWLVNYSIGLSIEFLLAIILIIVIAKRNLYFIQTDYSAMLGLKRTQNIITSSYVAMISQKDSKLEDHLSRCSNYVTVICQGLREQYKYANLLSTDNIFLMSTSALIHDIGLIAIPDNIIQKIGNLNPEEEEILNTHTKIGSELIKANLSCINDTFFKYTYNMARFHHERWDGTGFPEKLKGEEIPLCARIMAIANKIDAMLDPLYTEAQSFEEVMDFLQQEKAKSFDPDLVNAVLNHKDEIYQIHISKP